MTFRFLFNVLAVWTVNCALGEKVKPNIIYILLDDLGYGDISATGAEYITPNFDEFYNSGIEIESHYIGLLCSPSRSQMITGRYAWHFGLSHMDAFGMVTLSTLPAGVPTMGNLMKEYGGYSTYAIGKWHLGFASWEHTPLYRGFDHFFGFYLGGVDYYNKTFHAAVDWRADNKIDWETRDVFSTWSSRDRLLNIIDEHSYTPSSSNDHDNTLSGKPFYIWAALQAPHSHLRSVNSENVANCQGIKTSGNTAALAKKRDKFCENVMALDQLLGEVFESLKDNNLWDNTLVVLTSDNGGDLNEGGCNYPFSGEKTSYWDGGIKTLAVVGGGYILNTCDINNIDKLSTGITRHTRSGLMHSADWVPTLLSIAGIDVDYVDERLKNTLYYPLYRDYYLPGLSSTEREEIADGQEEYSYSSFDGYDLSKWLIYGDENDNPRQHVALSIVEWTALDVDTGVGDLPSIAIVFKSDLTGNTYKLIKSPQLEITGITTFIQDRCEYCINETTGERYRCIEIVDFTTSIVIHDLTFDKSETYNLYQIYDTYADSYRETEYNEFDNRIKLTNIKDYYNNFKMTIYIISNLLSQAESIVDGYSSHWMYNQFSDCANEMDEPGFALHFNETYRPWYDFDEYVDRWSSGDYCKDKFDDALVQLYTTTYTGSIGGGGGDDDETNTHSKTGSWRTSKTDSQDSLVNGENFWPVFACFSIVLVVTICSRFISSRGVYKKLL